MESLKAELLVDLRAYQKVMMMVVLMVILWVDSTAPGSDTIRLAR